MRTRDVHEKYPELYQFLGGSFYEDWFKEYASAEIALDTAISKRAPALLRVVRVELRRFMDEMLTPKQLDDILLHGLGMNYYTLADGRTKLEWLQFVQRRLDEAIARDES